MSCVLASVLPGGMAAGLMHADLSDVIKGLFILVFILGPVLKKLLAGVSEIRTRSDRPARPQGSEAGTPAPRPTPVTWEDLMRGAIPDPPPVPDVDADIEMSTEFEPPAQPLGGLDDSGLDEALAGIPSEDELERSGGTGAIPETAWASSDLEGPIQGLADPADSWVPLAEDLSESSVGAPIVQRVHARRGLVQAGGLRRAVIMAEVLAAPLAVREHWSHPGPPQGER